MHLRIRRRCTSRDLLSLPRRDKNSCFSCRNKVVACIRPQTPFDGHQQTVVQGQPTTPREKRSYKVHPLR
jgi:hypothetical protein